MPKTLKKAEILRGKKNFQIIFDRGKRIQGRLLQCLVLNDAGFLSKNPPRVVIGAAVGSRLKKATQRNRIKRLIRESYRLNKEIILSRVKNQTNPMALMFVYRTRSAAAGSHDPSYDDIERDVKELLGRVVERGQC